MVPPGNGVLHSPRAHPSNGDASSVAAAELKISAPPAQPAIRETASAD